jgi:hypothetical protein
MNLNKLTKAELINKLTKAEVQKGKLEPKIEQLKVEKLKSNKEEITINKKSLLFYEIISKIRNLIISLSVVAFLMIIFRNYKTIRVVLRTANYIILTIFGISIFDAFGLGFITKFLWELKYIFVGIATYLTETTFYNYLMNIFNVTSEKESIRASYNKPAEIDWKAEFEKAERRREIEEWKNKYNLGKEKATEDNSNRNILVAVGTILLVLGGSVTIWYLGSDIVSAVSPYWNIGNLIRRILRGGDDDDDNGGNGNPPVVFMRPEEDGRASPGLLVYSSDMVDATPKASSSQLPPAPPAPPAPTIPTTEQGMPDEVKRNKPASLLEELRKGKGKALKATKTIIKDKSLKGVETGSSSVSSVGLAGSLSEQLGKMRGVISDSADEIVEESWDNSEIVQTKDSIESRTKRSKFLDAIHSGVKEKKNFDVDIPNILKPILKQFPNLSEETINKLKTVEGMRNRAEIIQSLPLDELKMNKITPAPLEYLTADDEKGWKDINSISEQEKTEMDKLIDSTLNLDSEKVVEKLREKFPDFKFETDSYSKNFMKAIEAERNSGKTIEEKETIRKQIQEVDLLEIQNTGGTSNISAIRNVIRENYTHNSLLNEIKNKPSMRSINKEKSSFNTDKFDDELTLFE